MSGGGVAMVIEPGFVTAPPTTVSIAEFAQIGAAKSNIAKGHLKAWLLSRIEVMKTATKWHYSEFHRRKKGQSVLAFLSSRKHYPKIALQTVIRYLTLQKCWCQTLMMSMAYCRWCLGRYR